MTFDIADLIAVIEPETDKICQIGYIIDKDKRGYAQSNWVTIDWISKREANKGKTYKRVLKLDCKFYSFNKSRNKYRVIIWGKYMGWYNTEEEAKQAVIINLEKLKSQPIVSE